MQNREDLILNSLDRINNKLDKHEKKFDSIAETLKKLVEVDMRLKEYEGSLRRAFKRIEEIEKDKTVHGCTVLNRYWSVRSEQLKRFDEVLDEHQNKLYEHQKIINDIKAIPNKIMWKMLMTGAGGIGVWFAGKIILEQLK